MRRGRRGRRSRPRARDVDRAGDGGSFDRSGSGFSPQPAERDGRQQQRRDAALAGIPQRLGADLGERVAARQPHREVELGRAGSRAPRARRPRRRSRARRRTGARSAPRRAPSASALNASAPLRTPESSSTGTRPPTASTTPGSASSVAIAPSTWRPPWLETTMPSMPASSARRASSGCRMPLSRIGSFVRSRRNGRSSQVSDGREKISVKRCTAARPRPRCRLLQERAGIRARQLHQRAQRLRRRLRRRRLAAARALRPSAARNTGSLVYCAMPWPRRNGRKAGSRSRGRQPSDRRVERDARSPRSRTPRRARRGSRRARPTCSSRAGTSAGCRPAPRRTPPSGATPGWRRSSARRLGARRARPRGRPRGGRARARRPARAGTASRAGGRTARRSCRGRATSRSIRGTIRWRSNAARFSRTVSSVPAPALM